jgi:hypothetical protein
LKNNLNNKFVVPEFKLFRAIITAFTYAIAGAFFGVLLAGVISVFYSLTCDPRNSIDDCGLGSLNIAFWGSFVGFWFFGFAGFWAGINRNLESSSIKQLNPTVEKSANVEVFTDETLLETSKQIAMRILGNIEAIRGRVNCDPSNDNAYCVTTNKTAEEIFCQIVKISQLKFEEVVTGYRQGSFNTERFNPYLPNVLSSRYSYKQNAEIDYHSLWLSDYKRKLFKITYTPSPNKDEKILRVEASWIDGYTPSPEEK